MAKYRAVRAQDVVEVPRALADLTRLRVLHGLSRGELCVCQITELAGLAASTVSRHMQVLQRAGLVESRKEGRWVYYRLPQQPGTQAAGALRWALEAFASTEQARRDAEVLKEIKSCAPGELCRKQSGR